MSRQTVLIIAEKLRLQASNLIRMANELDASDDSNNVSGGPKILRSPKTGKILWQEDDNKGGSK